jgi:hypothetical protein
MNRLLFPVAPLFAAFFASAALAGVVEEVRMAKPLKADGVVAVSNVNGSVKITGWAEDRVEMVALKQASTESDLKDIEIRVVSSPDRFSVETRTPERSWWSWGRSSEVRYELRVPKGARIDHVDTVNGSVELRDLTGSVRAETVNGSIRGFALSSGARLETVNGSIRVALASLLENARCNFESVNGSITLGLPASACAELRADTVNGSIRNEFGLPNPKDSPGGESFRGTLGNGSSRVSASTVNGSIRFVKGGVEEL